MTCCLVATPALFMVDGVSAWLPQQRQPQGDPSADFGREGGGGLSLEFVQDVVIEGCVVAHNTALGTDGLGGGMDAFNCGHLLIRQSVFVNNSASYEVGQGYD